MQISRKGFFTIDAFFAFMLLVSVSGMLIGLAQSQEQVSRGSSATLQADMVTEKLVAVINSVYSNGAGGGSFDMRIELPNEIMGQDYTITFDNENRRISIPAEYLSGFGPGVASAMVIPGNVSSFELGPEDLKKTIRVYWVENTIRVRSVEG